ncbi:MAG: hypothetical protein AAGI51_15730 [Pseudomonadota bacterium]
MLTKLATFFLIGMVILAMVSARPRKGDQAFDKRGRWARLLRRRSDPRE